MTSTAWRQYHGRNSAALALAETPGEYLLGLTIHLPCWDRFIQTGYNPLLARWVSFFVMHLPGWPNGMVHQAQFS
jgi:hypothetical protein